jgi:Uma2 family endonuclease
MELYARGGISSYWIIDPLAERVTLTQYLLGPGGIYQERLRADDVVTLDEPWKVVLDLPAMTLERDGIHPASHPYR